MSDENPIIVALDTPDLDSALRIAQELHGSVGSFKIGLELFTSVGVPRVLEAFRGLPLFADVKFSDIPNTVGAAARELNRYPVRFFDVHSSCGFEGIRAASLNKGNAKLLVVTVLTSMEPAQCQEIFGDTPENTVVRFAKTALAAGADGIVCSPRELNALSQHSELSDLLKVTPGIRPAWASQNDQKRSLTPLEAIRAGATHIVIGRPILHPPQGLRPKEAALKILEEIHRS